VAEKVLLTVMRCLHDPANVKQTFRKCNAGRLLDHVNTLLGYCASPARSTPFAKWTNEKYTLSYTTTQGC